jgi:vancomycin resistance protein YoaR
MINKKIKTGIIIAIVLGVILFLPLIISFGKSGRETAVLGKNYSLLGKKEIEEKLQKDFPLPEEIILSDDERQFNLNLASLSAKVNEEKMVSNLLYRRLNQGLSKYIMAYFKKNEFDLEISVDNKKLEEKLTEISGQIEKPFIPSELVLEKGKVVIKDGQLGKKVEVVALKNNILLNLKKYRSEEISIPVTTLGQLPTLEQKELTMKNAEKLIVKKIFLKWMEEKSEMEKETLINFLSFDNRCQEEKVKEYIESFNESIKKEAKDAAFKFENGKVIEFEAAKNGYSVDKDKFIDLVCSQLYSWKDSQEIEIIVELPLIMTEPKIKTDEVNNLGIKELLGRGTSSFRHSSEIRNFNVEKGSSIVNRILVAPDETFSFVKNLGEVTMESGYKKAYIIRAGKTELDVGGGICQVSTTLFRAILDAGLPITERKAHAYRVSYYEEDSKPGFDATVFIPSPDLKFVNDTGHHLLIQSTYDGKIKKLTYEIYGTSDGRKVEISNYRQWDAAPAPPDVWIDDPTLPPGKVVKDESRIPGLKTSFEWKVTRGEEIIHQKTFVSSYVPWAAVYRRGPSL